MIQKDVFVSSNLVGTVEDISTTLFSYSCWAYKHSALVSFGLLIVFRDIYLLMVRDIYGWRKISVKGIRNYKSAAERFRAIDGTTIFLRQTLRVTSLEAPAICPNISRHAQKMHRSCVENGLILAVLCRCALLAQLEVGGGRNQVDLSQLQLWKSWRPEWGQLECVCVPPRRGWVGEVFPHMACNGDLSLAVLHDVRPSPVG